MFQPSLVRRLCAAVAILAASATSVMTVRGHQKHYAPDAPAYRQKGAADAPIVIVEFSDFQCPACRYAVGPAKNLIALYGKDVRFIFKHFPLMQHPLAKGAAIAAECAGRQGRFWDFHDLIYEKQEDWVKDTGGTNLQDYAKSLNLDLTAFSVCLKDPSAAALVDQDLKDGNDHWILSTPTFFINGKRFIGAPNLTGPGVIWIDKILKKS